MPPLRKIFESLFRRESEKLFEGEIHLRTGLKSNYFSSRGWLLSYPADSTYTSTNTRAKG